jgi:hypothetical protein
MFCHLLFESVVDSRVTAHDPKASKPCKRQPCTGPDSRPVPVPVPCGHGMQPFVPGDRLGLLLDCGRGSLTVYKNGERLGVAVAGGLSGELCWVVAIARAGQSVRVAAQSPQLCGLAAERDVARQLQGREQAQSAGALVLEEERERVARLVQSGELEARRERTGDVMEFGSFTHVNYDIPER